MKTATILTATLVWFALTSPALATTYGSVEPIANVYVIDTTALRDVRLDVRAAFAERLLQCGIVNQVIASDFGVPNHLPTSRVSRSKYGMMAISASAADGTITPASAGCMWSSSSWRPRKYHGAFDGFGVLSTLAWPSSGA